MPDLTTIARWLILLGLIIVAVGGLLLLAGRLNIPLGKLPGDIQFQTKNISCVFPLATSLIISVLLTLLLNIILRWLK
jgi:hypothetical protein